MKIWGMVRRFFGTFTLLIWSFTAGASAGVVVLGQSTGAAASFDDNTASVFVLPHGGLMVDVSVNGQQVKYQSFNA
jgi:lipid-binding SYLF domain-containing protein